MKTIFWKYRKIFVILLAAFMLAFTGCAGAHVGMSYGVTVGGGPGGAAMQPHFNVGVYGGGRVW